MAAGERPFLDRTLSQLRQERLAAVAAWRAAGGSWAPGERPTHPTLFAVVEDLEHRYYDLSASLLPPDPDGLLRRLRERDRDAVEEAISWLEQDHFARWTGYLKQKIMRRLSQVDLSGADRDRLRQILLAVCSRGRRQEFEEARRLARRRLPSQEFAEELKGLAVRADSPVTRDAAARMLASVKSAM